ncbi:MAG: hypothetical protein QOI39_859 [Mycobacterium sp.]|jgi:hypothetical protein|nr:hypothetical protein [Mycobacterium sp.]
MVLVHSEFWRLGDGGQGMADAVGSPDGWALGLRRFADFASGSEIIGSAARRSV